MSSQRSKTKTQGSHKKGKTKKTNKEKEKPSTISADIPSIYEIDSKINTNSVFKDGIRVPKDSMVQFDDYGTVTKSGLTGLSPRSQSALYEAILNKDRDFVKSLPPEIRQDLRDFVVKEKPEWLGESVFAEQFVARVAISSKENLISWFSPLMSHMTAAERAVWNEMYYHYAIDLANDIIKCSEFDSAMYVLFYYFV